MKRALISTLMPVLSITLVVAGATSLWGGEAVKTAAPVPTELQQRIDFGNAHIMGQSIKSGAVYLMHRKKSSIDSMLKVRQDFRQEIMQEHRLENTALIRNAGSGEQGEEK